MTRPSSPAIPSESQRKFPEHFQLADLQFTRLIPRADKAALSAFIPDSFSLLHHGEQGITVSARIGETHSNARNRTGGNNFFGARLITDRASNTLVGCYCVGVNRPPVADYPMHAVVGYMLMHRDAGAESGLPELMLNDLQTRAALWAGEGPRCAHCLAIIVTKVAIGSVLKQRGFVPSPKPVQTNDFGPAVLYTQVYGRIQED